MLHKATGNFLTIEMYTKSCSTTVITTPMQYICLHASPPKIQMKLNEIWYFESTQKSVTHFSYWSISIQHKMLMHDNIKYRQNGTQRRNTCSITA